jgi:hypothetical protein
MMRALDLALAIAFMALMLIKPRREARVHFNRAGDARGC